MDAAKHICQSIPAGQEGYAQAMHLAGVIAMGQGDLHEAEGLIRRAVAADPHEANYQNTLGSLLRRQGLQQQARACFELALEIAPGNTDAAFNLANLLKDQGQLEEAGRWYRQVLDWLPQHHTARLSLGYLLRRKGEMQAAEDCFRKVLAEQGVSAEAVFGLGSVLFDQRLYEQAEAYLRQAVQLQPGNAYAHFYLGNTLHARGKLSEAEMCHRRCVKQMPDFVRAWNNLGNDLRDQGRHAEAESCFRRALAIDPGHMRAHSNLLFLQHCFRDDGAAILQEHRRWADIHAAPLYPIQPAFSNDRNPDRRLRIGYISPDFCRHSVAFFLESLLAHHDPEQVHVIAYADVAEADEMTERLRSHAHAWRTIAFDDDGQVAARVRDDRVDILVDLAGHTSFHRLLVFARRPAPVQVTYLGYPATTGVATMDYRLTDAVADPDGAEHFASESLLRLPRCFLAFTPPADAPEVAPLPALENGHITFGSFNHLAKVTPDVVALWSGILERVAQSRIVLKHFSLQDEGVRRRYLDLFRQHGVDETRIELLPWSSNPHAHLKCYAHVDIALDPFPYNGTTTTCESLWMGVPVITLAGKTHAGLVGASLLHAVGHHDWVAASKDEYVALACRLADGRNKLAGIRKGLRAQMRTSSLCDAHGLARAVETAYRDMWRRWCEA